MTDETQAQLPSGLSRDERLEQVLAEYLRQLEQVVDVDQQALLTAHPDLADDLREFFANHDRLKRLAAPLIESVPPHEQSTTVHSELAQVGLCIGSYTLIQKLGEGGMGEVWVAKQSEPVKRKVALKLIRHGSHSKEMLTRFEHERQALAMMDHPNIARVFDGGAMPSGQPYFVMELVNGLPVTQYCDEARLTLRERMELFVPICQAVQHAHQKGIVHRDLKPSNILVTIYDGEPVPKVIDFGVAKATGGKLTDDSMSTQFGAVVGTLEYMSPEQTGFNGQDVDTRADIFSLGVILYELLTGLRPMDGLRLRKAALTEMIRVIQEDEPSKPSTRLSADASLPSQAALRQIEPKRLTASLRGELDWVVMKCLEKSRDRRYETVNGLARDIEHYLADEPVEARPPSASYRLSKFLRRNKGPVLAASLVLVALIAGILGTSWGLVRAEAALRAEVKQRGRADDKSAEAIREKAIAVKQTRIATEEAKEVEKQRQLVITERDRAKDLELLARRRLYASQVNLAHQAWESGQVTRVLELLEDLRPNAGQEDLRTFEWYYLWRLCHTDHRLTLTGHTGPVVSISVSPDGTKLASGGSDTNVKIWDLVNGKELITLKGHKWWVFCVAFSPDGKTLATGSGDREVRLWDVTTWQHTTIISGDGGMIRSLAFTPDGKTLAVGTSLSRGDENGVVKLWNIPEAKEIASLKCDAMCIISVAISPDGKKLASASGWGNPSKVRLWDLTTEQPQLIREWGGASSVVFSPDGTILAASSGTQIRLWDITTGKESGVYQVHSAASDSVTFSPDGKLLAMGCTDRTVRLWEPKTGRVWTMSHLHVVSAVTFTPDGKSLASASHDRTIKVWNVNQKSNELTLHGHQAGRAGIAYSSDGKTLAYAATGTVVRLCNPTTGETRSTLAGSGDSLSWVNFSRDSKHLSAGAFFGSIRLWDVATSRDVATIENGREIYALALSTDGKTLVASSGESHEVQFWDIGTQRVRAKLKRDTIGAITYSPDGKLLALADKSGWVDIVDSETLTRKLRCDATKGNWIWALVFSPNGETLVTGGEHGFMWAWDVTTGKLLTTFRGHTAKINDVAFFPDGNTLVSGCNDGTVKLWDVVTGQERLTLLGHSDRVVSVAVSPDGKALATGSEDGTMKVWRAAENQDAFANHQARP